MRKAVCILCRNYNETWITFLKSFKNYDVYMVIDDNTIIYPKKINNVFIIQIPDEECMKSHYYNSSVASNLKPIVSWDRALYYFSTMGIRQTLSSHSSTPEFQRNVTPNGSTFLQTPRPEMRGPQTTEIDSILSGLKTKNVSEKPQTEPIQMNIYTEDDSMISISSLKEIQNQGMPKRSHKRKNKSDKNTISLDI